MGMFGSRSLEPDARDEGSMVALTKEVFPGNWQRAGGNRTEQRRSPTGYDPRQSSTENDLRLILQGTLEFTFLRRAVTEAREL